MSVPCRSGVGLASHPRAPTPRARNVAPRGHPTTFEIFRTVDDVERFAPGDVIFTVGETGDCMYVVRSGTVTIHAEGLPIEEVGPGGIFGELALIDSAPRSATATAATACELVVLNERASCSTSHRRRSSHST